MIVQSTTLQDLRSLAKEFQNNIALNTQRLAATNMMIEVIEKTQAKADALKAEGFPAKVTNAIHQILYDEGPMHRTEVMQRLQDMGLEFTGVRPVIEQVASFLTAAPRARSLRNGIWEYSSNARPPTGPKEVQKV